MQGHQQEQQPEIQSEAGHACCTNDYLPIPLSCGYDDRHLRVVHASARIGVGLLVHDFPVHGASGDNAKAGVKRQEAQSIGAPETTAALRYDRSTTGSTVFMKSSRDADGHEEHARVSDLTLRALNARFGWNDSE